jgi:4-hydroxy-3-methylbut-2-en-1-yl diphosphate synthase IspG/GcpE
MMAICKARIELEAERIKLVKNQIRCGNHHPKIKDIHFEKDVILKMIELS